MEVAAFGRLGAFAGVGIHHQRHAREGGGARARTDIVTHGWAVVGRPGPAGGVGGPRWWRTFQALAEDGGVQEPHLRKNLARHAEASVPARSGPLPVGAFSGHVRRFAQCIAGAEKRPASAVVLTVLATPTTPGRVGPRRKDRRAPRPASRSGQTTS